MPYADELDFSYENCEGGVRITKYTGTETIVKIPETISKKTVVSIGGLTLMNNSTVKAIKIPSKVTVMEMECFFNCALENIDLPEGLQKIAHRAFYNCNNLKSLTIPSTVTDVDKENSKGAYIAPPLEIIYKGKTYDKNNNGIFYDTVNYPSGYYAVNGKLWQVSRALESFTVPSGITTIETAAFSGCKLLTSITIPEGVTELYSNSTGFGNCPNLKSLTLPDSLKSISEKALGIDLYSKSPFETITWRGTTYKSNQFSRLCQDVNSQ